MPSTFSYRRVFNIRIIYSSRLKEVILYSSSSIEAGMV